MSRESKTLKKSSSDWLNSGKAEWKNAIFMFPILPGSAEAQVIWGGIVKHNLIAYFIGNISAKKYQNRFTCVTGYSKPKMARLFETQCTCFAVWVNDKWWRIFTCAQKLANSQLNLPHGTKQKRLMKKLKIKTEMLRRNGPVIKPWSQSWRRKGVYMVGKIWRCIVCEVV